MSIQFTPNPDILQSVGQGKHKALVVGFSLETQNRLKNAQLKLKRKKCHLMVANGPNNMNNTHAQADLLSSQGHHWTFPKGSKKQFSLFLLNKIALFMKEAKHV